MLKIMLAALAGGIFAAGLVLSGMVLPAKVQGFLNLGGLWDPQRFGPWDASLAFVMGGALLVTLLAFAVTPPTPRHPARKPWLAAKFQLPARKLRPNTSTEASTAPASPSPVCTNVPKPRSIPNITPSAAPPEMPKM